MAPMEYSRQEDFIKALESNVGMARFIDCAAIESLLGHCRLIFGISSKERKLRGRSNPGLKIKEILRMGIYHIDTEQWEIPWDS
jgi:hypothetical protein